MNTIIMGPPRALDSSVENKSHVRRKKSTRGAAPGIIFSCIAGAALLLLISTAGHATAIHGGYDFYTTDGGELQFSATPLPADFFGAGSDPFDQVVPLEGNPFYPPDPFEPDTTVNFNFSSPLQNEIGRELLILIRPTIVIEEDPPPMVMTDTIVRRIGDTPPLRQVGDTATVETEIIALSLVSAEPIPVTYGGTNPQFFDIFVELDPSAGPQPTGALHLMVDDIVTAGRNTMISGTASLGDASNPELGLPMIYQLRFVEVGNETNTIVLAGQAADFFHPSGRFQFVEQIVPEPAAGGLLLLGMAVLCAWTRGRRFTA